MAKQQQNIGEVLQFFNEARRPVKSSDRVPGPFPYLGASGTVDYVEGFTHEGSYLCVSEDGANLLTRSLPIAWVQDGKFWANNHLQVLGGVSREHLTFFRYAIESTNIAAYVTGSAQPKLSKASLSSVKVPKFSRREEERIGKLLSAIDDKITTNSRIINVSDALVEALYSQVTKKPTAQTFDEVAKVFGGSTPSTKNDAFWYGDINWATPTDITALDGPWIGDTNRKITEAGLASMSSSLHPENSILMTSRATIGAIALASGPIATNQGFIVVEAPDALTPWLFAQMKARKREFEVWANGATFMELSRGNFKKLPFIGCSEDDLQAFNDAAWPLLKRAQAAQKNNLMLARTRDELLPLLMSGRITVGEAEVAADEAASES